MCIDELSDWRKIQELTAENARLLGEKVDLEEQKARLEAALREIAEHPHKAYDDGQSGSYGIGIADGHRCAANIAQAALAGLSPADRETSK